MTTTVVNNSLFRSLFEKQKLTGNNFLEWYRNLRIVLSTKDKLPFLEQPIPALPVPPQGQANPPDVITTHQAWVKAQKEIDGLMLMTMDPEIQKTLEHLGAYDMLKELKTLYVQQEDQELFQTVREFHACKQEEGLILVSLRKEYEGFVQNYNMHSMGKTVNELHAMLKLHEQTLPPKEAPPFDRKPKNPPTPKKDNPAKDAICHQCGEVGHWRRNCLIYLTELMKKKKLSQGASTSGIFTIELYSFPSTSWVYDTGCGTHICITTQGLKGSRNRAAVEAIGDFHLCLPSGLVLILHNCHYAHSITRGIISVSRLYKDGFVNRFEDDNSIFVFKNNMIYFNAIPRDDIYEIVMSSSNTNECSINDRDVEHDGLLYSTDIESFEKCVACMSGKMARKPYSHQVERAKDLLGLIHTDEKLNTARHGSIHDESNHSTKVLLGYALESAARILNMVLTKKVDKTPYEVWHGQAPKLSYLKVWGCEALVKRDILTKPDKLEPRALKCIFVGYPKETMGYSFYYPPENKIFVSRNVEFFENDVIDHEASGSLEDLEIIQEDTHPSLDTSLDHKEDDQEIDEPQSDLNPIPALLDPESDKWLNAMNVEMQSMKDNEVWELVELPPDAKTVGHKWLFKKKTDMDGAVHTYKARLVAKGFTQTPGIDYEETFSPVADIRAIRILIAIAAFYDYEIWQMDVKTAFLNGYLNEEVYMEQPEGEAAYILGIKIYRDRSKRLIGLCQSAYIEKILKRFYMENSKRGTIPMQEKLKLSKSQDVLSPDLRSLRKYCRFQQNPGDDHWTAVKNILKYLRNTKDMFLVYGGDMKRELRVSCYTDAGYLTDADDMKSQTGYVFVLNGGAVDWKSTKQSIFATSSTDAEYIAAFDASKEAIWIRKFIYGLGVVPTIEEPINMYCDNTGAIAIAKDHGVTKGARHFRAKVHYLRETIEMGDVKIDKVDTDDNLADPFTKALAFPKHSELTEKIGMIPASSLMTTVQILSYLLDPATATESSRTPSTIEKSPLDFANENPSQQISEGDGTGDQVRDEVSREIPSEKNPTTTGVVPELENEVAVIGPRVNKRRRKRASDEADANAPPKVLRKDHVVARPEQSAKSVSDPDPLSYARPQPHPEQDMAQSSKETAPEISSEHVATTEAQGQTLVESPEEENLPAFCPWMGWFEQEARLLKKATAKIAKRDQWIQAREEYIKKLEQETSSLRTVDTEVQGLRNQAMNLETLLEAELSQQVSTLQAQVTGEERIKAAFEEFKKYEDERVNSRCAKMDARLDKLSVDFDEELYPHMLTAIAGRRWVIGHGLRIAVMKSLNSATHKEETVRKGTRGQDCKLVHDSEDEYTRNREGYFNICIPLYAASVTGDWEADRNILDRHPERVRCAIADNYDDLELQDIYGYTAFCKAALAGNVKRCEYLFEKNHKVLHIPARNGKMPLNLARNGKMPLNKQKREATRIS
ncbi:retrotransposon protein, putative, ty1-copia subclass [Tanacetum coccineum]